MEQAVISYFSQEVLSKLRSMQDREHVHRTVTGEYEPVNFPPNSSFRFWVNTELKTYDLHWHASTEIIVPIKEPLRVVVRQQEYCVNEGDIFIIPAGELHEFSCTDKGIRLKACIITF